MGCAGSKASDLDDPGRKHGGGDDGEDEYAPLTQEDIKARIQCSDGELLFPLGESGLTMRYAYLSQRGYYPEDLYKANQDAFKVVPNFNGDPSQILFGVFDGHGVDGDSCSYYVRDNIEATLKSMIAKYPNDFERAYKETFIDINHNMHEQKFDDSMSGTTAITAFFRGTEMRVANIGDSRAVVGEKKGKRTIAYSLSIDQTPYRQDERERVKAAGAVVMSCDQLEGIVPYHENWGVNLGEELDNGGDPPRVWAPGKTFPGCAFTRSIGDAVAEQIGVCAEPELLAKHLTTDDQFVVIASDGVWEFLTNQSVADMILKFTDPLEACRAVVAESYRLWLQYEVRTDDITMILGFLEGESATADDNPSDTTRRRRESRRGSADQISVGLDIVSRAGGENRPVKRGISKEKRQALAIAASTMAEDEEDDADYDPGVVPKTPDEIDRISSAIKANFLFAHLNQAQRQKTFDVMKRVPVKKGEVVIRQGDQGDWFYVVDMGEYSVTITPPGGGPAVEILKYTTDGGTNPCFGELALMYSKPRAATVTAITDGSLWALDRRSFKSLLKSSSKSIIKTLRKVEVLKSLSVGQLQRLGDVLTEVSFKDGEYIFKQGETSSTFYVISEGTVKCTKGNELLMELTSGHYFGERALLEHQPRAANCIAVGKVKCLYISKDAFEEVLGSLQAIIDNDRQWREKVATSKQLQQEAEGLAGVSFSSFTVNGVVMTNDPSSFVLATHKGREYTVKAISKSKVEELSQQQRVLNEKNILTGITASHPFVPLALAFLADASYLYVIFKTSAVISLGSLMDEQSKFAEPVAKFYVANVANAITHLHAESIIYRNVAPDNLCVTSDGYVQLMDMACAVKVYTGDKPRDYCGAAHYLSPEQVSGQGHGQSVDYWALGILMHEMLLGQNPWLTGDDAKDSEVGIYNRITAHTANAIAYTELTPEAEAFLNGLLMPAADERLGTRGVGAEEVRASRWMAGLDWNALTNKALEPPHVSATKSVKPAAVSLSDEYSGDGAWCKDFSSFVTGA